VKIIATGKLLLVSRSDTGVKGNRFSHEPSLSGNGRKVAFSSTATNLDPADTDLVDDIFVKNIASGDVELASTSDTGVKGNGASAFPVLSSDGKRVAFISLATNLDPADTDTDWDVYEKNLTTGDISLVTSTAAGVHGNQTNQAALSISGAGKLVAFSSNATNLDGDDTDKVQDIYVKNSTTCTIAGTSADETLAGTSGDDVICGEGGNDTINASGGDDILFGGNGTDLLVGGPGADTMNADGLDQLGYPDSDEGVTVDLGAHTASGGDATGDTWVGGVESLEGSNFADTLIGDGKTNLLLGLGDDDVLAGAGGGDALIGGSGTDVADYRTSPAAVSVDLTLDVVDGGDAEGDGIISIEGAIGSAFDDTFLGDSGDTVFEGARGADSIDGGAGVDRAEYELSGTAVNVNLNDGTFSGGDADGDALTGIEDLSGSGLGDTLVGDNGPNVLSGLAGGDTLKGKNGDDTLIGAGGTDAFDGGGGTDACDNTGGESATQCEP
jgi:Ca2+-binding RTX toxin-like protein